MASSISLSGMQAALTALDSASHNLANLATPGFRRERVQSSTQAGGGVQVARSQALQPGEAAETDLVATLQAKNLFMANLAVFRSGQQMLGTLLDEAG